MNRNWFGRQMARITRGRALIGLFSFAGIYSLVDFEQLFRWQTLMSLIGASIIVVIAGYLDEKYGTWPGQIGHQARLNPVLIEILERVKNIENDLTKRHH